MISSWVRVGPNPKTGVLTREEFGLRDTDTQGECHVTTETEIGVGVYTGQWAPRISSTPHELGGARGPPLEPSE